MVKTIKRPLPLNRKSFLRIKGRKGDITDQQVTSSRAVSAIL